MVLPGREQGPAPPALLAGLGLPELRRGEDRALLRPGCFEKHLLPAARKEARSPARRGLTPASPGRAFTWELLLQVIQTSRRHELGRG